jgi:hypothetical protein
MFQLEHYDDVFRLEHSSDMFQPEQIKLSHTRKMFQ